MAQHTPAPMWGVLVDEIRLFSMGRAPGWWALELGRLNQVGKLRYLAVVPAGSVLEIGPFERDDAEFVREHLAEKGVDSRVLKLRKWTAQPHLPKCSRTKPCRLCTPTTVEAQQPAA